MRKSVQLVVVLMVLNVTGAWMVGSGYADATGFSGPAESDEINELEDHAADRPEFSGGGLATLFGFFTAAADWFDTVIGFITTWKTMLAFIFPEWFLNPLEGLVYFFLTADLIYVATQRSL